MSFFSQQTAFFPQRSVSSRQAASTASKIFALSFSNSCTLLDRKFSLITASDAMADYIHTPRDNAEGVNAEAIEGALRVLVEYLDRADND